LLIKKRMGWTFEVSRDTCSIFRFSPHSFL